MHKLFREIGITTLGNDTRGELDKEYISFLSNSTNKDTVILTNRGTLLRDFSKYKDIFIVDSFEIILELLSDMNNKDIFLDCYINTLTRSTTLSNFDISNGNQIDSFLRKFSDIAHKNNLKIVIPNQVYKANNHTSHLPSIFYYISNSTFIYDSVRQDLICKKSRYSEPEKSSFNLKDWKKSLRLKKIKRILE